MTDRSAIAPKGLNSDITKSTSSFPALSVFDFQLLAILHVACMLLARTTAAPRLPPAVQLHAVVQQSRSDRQSVPACLLWLHHLVSFIPQRLRQHLPL
jgi:hypothetical protein